MKVMTRQESLMAMKKYAEANLPELCAELAAWQNTSLLCEGRLRELADLCAFDDAGKIQQAERLIERMAVRHVAQVRP